MLKAGEHKEKYKLFLKENYKIVEQKTSSCK